MGISIKNEEVEQLVRELAHQTGLSMTEALQVAIEEYLQSRTLQISANFERDIGHAMRIAKGIASMPILDHRHPDDMLYDDSGLPR